MSYCLDCGCEHGHHQPWCGSNDNMRHHDDVVREVERHPMRVDPKNKGVVRGGWFDDFGGMLVGTEAQFVADAINEYVKIHIDKARGG